MAHLDTAEDRHPERGEVELRRPEEDEEAGVELPGRQHHLLPHGGGSVMQGLQYCDCICSVCICSIVTVSAESVSAVPS